MEIQILQGGSTGEPIRLIQDKEFEERSAAIAYLYSFWAGRDIGESEILLWGSERDIFHGRPPLKTRLGNWLRNSQTLNAFRMTPSKMREYIETLNNVRPKSSSPMPKRFTSWQSSPSLKKFMSNRKMRS